MDKTQLIYEAAMAMGYDAVKTRNHANGEEVMAVRITDMSSVCKDIDPNLYTGELAVSPARAWVEEQMSDPFDAFDETEEAELSEDAIVSGVDQGDETSAGVAESGPESGSDDAPKVKPKPRKKKTKT